MAQVGADVYSGAMASPELAVAAVVVEAETRLRVLLSAAAEAVEAADVGDLLAPGTWHLSGTAPVPRLVRVATQGPAARTAWLILDAPLTPGGRYAVGLDEAARSISGGAVEMGTVTFLAPTYGGLGSQLARVRGGDVSLPVRGSATGDLALATRLAALEERVRLRARSRRGTFTHAPGFGRGLEPKRTYSVNAIAAEAAAFRDDLASDPEVREARVAATALAGGLAFDIRIAPTFTDKPLHVRETIVAGGTE